MEAKLDRFNGKMMPVSAVLIAVADAESFLTTGTLTAGLFWINIACSLAFTLYVWQLIEDDRKNFDRWGRLQ